MTQFGAREGGDAVRRQATKVIKCFGMRRRNGGAVPRKRWRSSMQAVAQVGGGEETKTAIRFAVGR